MQSTDLSIILVIRNGAAMLPKALSHLEQQSHPSARYEVLVTDRGSTDDTLQVLERHAIGAPVRFRVLRASSGGLGAARNSAVNAATGRWILFLDADLLAGPRLVEQHVRMQTQHGGNCVVVGKIEQHPQVAGNVMVRHFATAFPGAPVHNQPLRFVDWRCWNLCAPRSVLVESKGFDESFELSGLDEVELAWRLERGGMQGYFNDQATAYAWLPVTVDQELARRYAEGFTLHRALEKTHSEVLANRYLGNVNRPWMSRGRVLAPMYHQICRTVATRVRPFEWMCRRMSHYAVLQGYQDAMRGRPPRYPADPPPSK